MSKGTKQTGQETYSYTYNAFGQRIKKTYTYLNTSAGFQPVYQGMVISSATVYEYDNSGRLVRETVNERHFEGTTSGRTLVYLYDASSMIGVRVITQSTTSTYYYNRNLQGDVTEIYTANGVLKAKYTYDAFGNCTVSGTDTSLGNLNPIRYRGYYFDKETGFYHLGARYYNPEWRRFISPDVIENFNIQSVNGLNLYIYADNNPLGSIRTMYTSLHSKKDINTFSVLGAVKPISNYSYGAHWKNEWFVTDKPQFWVFLTSKVALVDWGMSIYKGSLYFDNAENYSLYISVVNASAFIGYSVDDQKYGIFADANLLSVGYDGRYIDASVSVVGVGLVLGFEDGKLRLKLDPPGWFGFDFSIDLSQIFRDIFL